MSGDGDEDLAQYEHELENLTVEITEIISKITTPNKKAKMNPAEGLEKLQSRLKMAKTALKSYKIEMRTSGKSDVNTCKEVVKKYTGLIQEFETSCEMIEKNELTGGAANIKSTASAETMSTDQLLQKGDNIQKDDITRLKGMSSLMDDSKNMGVNGLAALQEQNDKLTGANDSLNEIESDLKLATKEIRQFARRLATDKVIQVFMFLVFLGVIAIIIVAAVKKKK
eukprot:TRINITY_DN13997_c0_g1_i1.p1 TRINITY_DN13997_c0_g1~~TRINITY_DN13997_c0_g1_i1.p1  ORF type:complete len:226 (+),score=73.62 TRINITY_DN13997_c0_g1_i1:21-698(+)